MWFAERLSRPVGRLTLAAQRVGEGDLDTQVREEEGDDEIAMLGTYFNQMTKQLKASATRFWRTRSRSNGVGDCSIPCLARCLRALWALMPRAGDLVNRAAERLLDWHEDQQSLSLSVAVPEFGALFERLRGSATGFVQEEIKCRAANGRRTCWCGCQNA